MSLPLVPQDYPRFVHELALTRKLLTVPASFPPYTSDLVKNFAGKLQSSFKEGLVTAALLLVNNATETLSLFPLRRWPCLSGTKPQSRVRYPFCGLPRWRYAFFDAW
jgi:hypothetical protein